MYYEYYMFSDHICEMYIIELEVLKSKVKDSIFNNGSKMSTLLSPCLCNLINEFHYFGHLPSRS